jgi:type 1 glutamine amidotransferase
MRVLVLCDDYWHPARTARTGLQPLEDAGFTFDWIEDASEWTAERMAQYPVVLLTKSNNVSATDRTNWITAENEDAFGEYVRSGKGLLVIHSGLAEYPDLPLMRGVMGGAFASHPPQCPVTVERRDDHPLTAGIAPFSVFDEHYMIDLDDDQADVFLTTTSQHGTQPGGWTRTEGTGRVCALTPGHNVEVWLDPAYQALLRNALCWCGRME